MKKCSLNGDVQPCVDECSGYESELPGLDSFKYRYYILGATSDLSSLPSNPRPDAGGAPFTPECIRGHSFNDLVSDSGVGEPGYTDDYDAAASAKAGTTSPSGHTCVTTNWVGDVGITGWCDDTPTSDCYHVTNGA